MFNILGSPWAAFYFIRTRPERNEEFQ